MSLRTKNIILFTALAIIPLIYSIIVYQWDQGPFEKASYDALNTIRSLKKSQIEEYILQLKKALLTSSETAVVQNALFEFQRATKDLTNRLDSKDDARSTENESVTLWYRTTFLETMNLLTKEKYSNEAILPEDPLTIYLQYHYLALNPFTIWEYSSLDQSIISDSYQIIHKKYHARFIDLQRRFELQDIYLLNSGGKIIYSVNKSILFGRSLAETQKISPQFFKFFYELKLNPKARLIVSDDFSVNLPYFGQPTAHFATPVSMDGDWGVLVFAINTSKLNQILHGSGNWLEEGLGESGEIFIANQNRMLISSSRLKIKSTLELNRLLDNAKKEDIWIGFENNKLDSRAIEHALEGQTGLIRHQNIQGYELISSYEPMQIDSFNWVIVSQKESKEALWGSEFLYFQLLLAGVAFIILTTLIQQVTTRIFINPITQLSEEAKRLSSGGTPMEIDPPRQDEIGELQTSFFEMSSNLFHIQKTLESQIKTCNLTADALRNSQSLLELVLERIPSAIYWKNSDHQFIGANDSFFQLMNLPHTYSISGKMNLEIFTDEFNQRLLEKIESSFRKLGSKEYLSIDSIKDRHGNLRLSTILLLSLLDEDGKAIGVLGLIEDLSTKTRTRDDLVAVQQLKVLDSITGGITHEFRNTLHALGGFLTLIDRVKNSDLSKLSKYMDESQSLIELATNLSDKLLTVTKAGNFQDRKHPIDNTIRSALDAVVANTQTLHSVWIDPRLNSHELERLSLHQICYNLMLNAVQAMNERGVLSIRALHRYLEEPNEFNLLEGQYLDLTIEDQGGGIPKDLEEKIFEPFFTSKDSGSGFGLPTVKTLVLKLKGGIFLKSNPPVGSMFHVLLPLKDIQKQSLTPMITREFLPGKGQILILDDRDIVLKSTQDLLELLGYNVRISKFVDDALQEHSHALRTENPFDVIIIDLQIERPGDGLEAIAKIREVDQESIAILSTAHIDDPAFLNHEQFGFDRAIRKPHDLSELSKTLWEVLQNRNQG